MFFIFNTMEHSVNRLTSLNFSVTNQGEHSAIPPSCITHWQPTVYKNHLSNYFNIHNKHNTTCIVLETGANQPCLFDFRRARDRLPHLQHPTRDLLHLWRQGRRHVRWCWSQMSGLAPVLCRAELGIPMPQRNHLQPGDLHLCLVVWLWLQHCHQLLQLERQPVPGKRRRFS